MGTWAWTLTAAQRVISEPLSENRPGLFLGSLASLVHRLRPKGQALRAA